MHSGTITFGSTLLFVAVGLLVLLYGVTLNSGQAVNTPMIAGGILALCGMGILTLGVLTLDEPATEA